MSRFEDSVLVSSDFDGTIGYTNEPAPNGMTVELAYHQAVCEVLGHEACNTYSQTGGLINRAPAEVVAALLPDTDEETQRVQTEALIQTKLGYLLDQIGCRLDDGTRWPRLTPGFPETWEDIQRLRGKDVPVHTAVISSGHTAFINTFFDTHGLKRPDFMVTDDDMRGSRYAVPLRVKPSPLLVTKVQEQWWEYYGINGVGEADLHVLTERTVYAGDDPTKDGQLARNSGIEFIHINPANSVPGWEKVGQWVARHVGVASAAV
ncbi:MAG TPA: hypothetical protein VHD60_02060 [Candidatus Saccharimonadales bacterium]|nr:hypothetical protein [Candidatus Saccharimonadales bacterium]